MVVRSVVIESFLTVPEILLWSVACLESRIQWDWQHFVLPFNSSVDEIMERRQKRKWKETHDNAVTQLEQVRINQIRSDLRSYRDVVDWVCWISPKPGGGDGIKDLSLELYFQDLAGLIYYQYLRGSIVSIQGIFGHIRCNGMLLILIMFNKVKGSKIGDIEELICSTFIM